MRDYEKLTNAQKRMVDEVNAKLGKRLEQHGFKVGYHPQLGTGLVLHSTLRRMTKVLNGPMHSVEGVEMYLEAYQCGHRDGSREVTAANEAALRKLMGVRVNPDGTLYVEVTDDMLFDEQD